MPDTKQETIQFFHTKQQEIITKDSFSPIHKLAISLGVLAVVSTLFVSLMLITNNNPVSINSTSQNTASIDQTGSVQGVSDFATTTLIPYTSPYTSYTQTNYTPQTTTNVLSTVRIFNAKSPIVLSGKLPSTCVNTDGFFCKADVSKVGTCHNGVCGATALEFSVTPDTNGNWSYPVAGGLDPGDYQVTIKDQTGKVLEVTNFTVINQSTATTTIQGGKNLPNTGVGENIIISLLASGLIIALSYAFFIKKGKSGRIIS